MAFDFGAALSSLGQIAPAMSEGAEIRRQRAADAAAVSERAQAAQDTHSARQAQTERERSLTLLDQRNATRLTPLSTKPEKGEDGKYYMLFADASGKPQRLQVEGNYDPLAEQKALLKELNIAEDSDLGKTVLLKLKTPTGSDFQKITDANGDVQWLQKPYSGIPSSVSPSAPGTDPSAAAPGTSTPGAPRVIPTGVKAKMPSTGSTSSHVYHWVDNAGNVHESPYTTTTKKQYGGGAPAGSNVAPAARTAAPQAPGGGKPASVNPRFTGLIGGDKVIGTGKLPATANRIVITTQPVIDQTDKLIQRIDQLGLANNNSSFYLARPYMEYRMFGKASDPGTLGSDIAGLSLGSVVDAAAALAGSSRSIQALKLAMVHTPNPAVDSPKLLREKLVTINSRLKDVVREAKSGGGVGAQDAQKTIQEFAGQSKPPNEVITVSPEDMRAP